MKKKTIWGSVMTMLSVIAVMVASYPAGVKVFHQGDATARVYSFFQQVPDSPIAMCLLFAALLSCVSLMLSVAFLVRHRLGWLKSIIGVSFASVTLAVIPIVARPDPMVLPNMGHPLAMGTVCVLAYLLHHAMKNKPDAEEPKGERLSLH